MPIVVADTGPLHYLVLIGEIGILPNLFENVPLPAAVCSELAHPRTPSSVRNWFETRPQWLSPLPGQQVAELPLSRLGDGERAVIALAISLSADLILMDDRAGAIAARRKGFAVIGTLGILDLAAKRGLVDLNDAFNRLKGTNFRVRPELLDALLAAKPS